MNILLVLLAVLLLLIFKGSNPISLVQPFTMIQPTSPPIPSKYGYHPQGNPQPEHDLKKKHYAQTYHDLYSGNHHRYPFEFYSLYGYDDNYPPYRYQWDIESPATQNADQKWSAIASRRNRGKEYIGLPSYNYIRNLNEPLN